MEKREAAKPELNIEKLSYIIAGHIKEVEELKICKGKQIREDIGKSVVEIIKQYPNFPESIDVLTVKEQDLYVGKFSKRTEIIKLKNF